MSRETIDGGCACGRVRYRLTGPPIIVHACHCTRCQRETGTAHALNAVYEAERVVHTGAELELVDTPSASGKGQRIARCATCRVAVWSNYSSSGAAARYVRVGTMDEPDRCPPDVHIFTSSKLPWVVLPPGARVFAEFYEIAEVYTPDSLERRRLMRQRAGLAP